MTVYLLHHLLREASAAYPGALAVSAGGHVLTYAELDEQSDRLAGFLRARGVRPGDRVGLLVRKTTPSAIVSIYGVLKAGAAYVPLDPNAPPARLGFILRDCGVRLILAHAGTFAPDSSAEVGEGDVLETLIVVDATAAEAPAGLPAANAYGWHEALSTGSVTRGTDERIDTDLAYILYTSGSTGQPKGVMISHRNALTFVNWSRDKFGLTSADRLSNHAPFHFDLSIFDVFVAAAAGASVHLVPDGLSTFPLRLAEWLESEEISIWYSVPSVLTLLALHGRLGRWPFRSLRFVLFAGEVFPLKHLQSLVASLPGPRYFNLYGPTETNVCTFHEVDRAALAARTTPIPIGFTCENMGTFALLETGERIERPGQTGELLVRGSGVAMGYWGRPERTEQGFVQNPLEPAIRDIAYRTGDLVTLDANGEYLYLGRVDHQIKSRGYRIELGEIESALVDHPLVREAVAIAVPDDLVGNRIKAVVALIDDATVPASELQAHCARRLPRYMIPELIAFRSELPRTLNGKIDRVELAGVEE